MKISIKGIFLSWILSLLAAFVCVIPLVAIFIAVTGHKPGNEAATLLAILPALFAWVFQGYLLKRIGGPEKFAGSVLVCAIIAGGMSLSSSGVLWGIVTFVLSCVVLAIGGMGAK